jgi:hypothetical protein
MEVIGAFIYTYLEYVVAGTCGVGFMGYVLTKGKRSSKHPSSNLRRYVVKYKKQQDALSKQIKGMVG